MLVRLLRRGIREFGLCAVHVHVHALGERDEKEAYVYGFFDIQFIDIQFSSERVGNRLNLGKMRERFENY